MDAEHTLVGDTFSSPGRSTVIAANAFHTGIAIEACLAHGRGPATALIAIGIAGVTHTLDALAAIGWTVPVALTAHTAGPAFDAEGRIPTTADIRPHLAERTGVIYALLTTAVGIV